MATISILESRARDILNSIDCTNSTTTEMMVRNVFWAMWSASLSIDHIEKINAAILGHDIFDKSNIINLTVAVKSLVKRQILRRRQVDGVSVYEIRL